jgi:hypothetical protein
MNRVGEYNSKEYDRAVIIKDGIKMIVQLRCEHVADEFPTMRVIIVRILPSKIRQLSYNIPRLNCNRSNKLQVWLEFKCISFSR